jgi:hypothetical protein
MASGCNYGVNRRTGAVQSLVDQREHTPGMDTRVQEKNSAIKQQTHISLMSKMRGKGRCANHPALEIPSLLLNGYKKNHGLF